MANSVDLSFLQHYVSPVLCADLSLQSKYFEKMKLIDRIIKYAISFQNDEVKIPSSGFDRIFLKEVICISNPLVKDASIDEEDLIVKLDLKGKSRSKHTQDVGIYPDDSLDFFSSMSSSIQGQSANDGRLKVTRYTKDESKDAKLPKEFPPLNSKSCHSLLPNPQPCEVEAEAKSVNQGRHYLKLISAIFQIERSLLLKQSRVCILADGFDRFALKRAFKKIFPHIFDEISIKSGNIFLEIRQTDYDFDKLLKKITNIKMRSIDRKTLCGNRDFKEMLAGEREEFRTFSSMNFQNKDMTWVDQFMETNCVHQLKDMNSKHLLELPLTNYTISQLMKNKNGLILEYTSFNRIVRFSIEDLLFYLWAEFECDDTTFGDMNELLQSVSTYSEVCELIASNYIDDFYKGFISEHLVNPIKHLCFNKNSNVLNFHCSEKSLFGFIKQKFLIETYEWRFDDSYINLDTILFREIRRSFMPDNEINPIVNLHLNGIPFHWDGAQLDPSAPCSYLFFKQLLESLCSVTATVFDVPVQSNEIESFSKAIDEAKLDEYPKYSRLAYFIPLLKSKTIESFFISHKLLENNILNELTKKFPIKLQNPQPCPCVELFVTTPDQFKVIHVKKYFILHGISKEIIGEFTVNWKIEKDNGPIQPSISIPYIFVEKYISNKTRKLIYDLICKNIKN